MGERSCWQRGLPDASAAAGLVSTFQLSGTPDRHFYKLHCRKYYNYFNFAEGKEEKQRNASVRKGSEREDEGWRQGREAKREKRRSTSEREYEVDA